MTIVASVGACWLPLTAINKHDPWFLLPLLVGLIILQGAAVVFWLVHRFRARHNAFNEFVQCHQLRWCQVSSAQVISTIVHQRGEIARVQAIIDDNVVVEFLLEGLQKPKLLELGFLAVRSSMLAYIVDGALTRQQHPIPIFSKVRLGIMQHQRP